MERIKPNHTGLSRPAIARLARQHGLARTISLGTDSHDFERMLNYSMQCWYRAQPQGATNYINPNFPSEIPMELRKDIGIGEVSFSRENHSHLGKAGLVYTPSAFYHKKFSYSEKQIAVIDLREHTFLTMWENKSTMGEDFWHIPTALMNDSEVVLPLLGLRMKK